MSATRKAAFLDRDGVINIDHGYVYRWDDFEFVPGAIAAMRRLQQAGYALVVVTNQSGIARGMYGEADLQALNQRMLQHLLEHDVQVTGIEYCPHLPEAQVAAYRQPCDCRKPAPGMLLRATAELSLDLRRSIMVGDRPSDVAAGRAAGCRTVWLHSGRHDDPPIRSATPIADARPDHVCTTLTEVAQWLGA